MEEIILDIYVGGNLNESNGTLKELKDSLKTLKKEIDGVEIGSQEFNKLSKEISTTDKQIKDLNKSIRQAAIEVKSLKDVSPDGDLINFKPQNIQQLKQYVKELKAELATQDFGSDRFDELANAVQKAQFELRDLNKDLKLSSANANNLEDIAGGASSLAAAFTVGTSAMALFGDTSEKTQETLLKVQAALALSQSLGQLKNLTIDMSKAQAALNNVMKANPYLLIAVAIIALLAATGNLDDIIKDLGQTLGSLFDGFQPIIDMFKDVFASLQPLMPLLLLLLKAFLLPSLAPLMLWSNIVDSFGEEIGQLTNFITGLIDKLMVMIKDNPFYKIAESMGLLGKESKEVKVDLETLKKVQESYHKSNELMNNALQREIDLRKAQGASIAEIERLELNQLKTKELQIKAEYDWAVAIKNRIIASGGQATQEQIDAFNEIEQNYLNTKNSVLVKEAQINTRRREDGKKHNEETKKDNLDALNKELEDTNKALDDKLIQKKAIVYKDHVGTVDAQKKIQQVFKHLELEHINEKVDNHKKGIVKIQEATNLDVEDKKKLLAAAYTELYKMEEDAAKAAFELEKEKNDNLKLEEEKNGRINILKARLAILDSFGGKEIKTQEQLNKALAELDLKLMKDKLATLDKEGEEYLQLKEQIAQKEVAVTEAKNKEEEELEKKKQEKIIASMQNSSNIISNLISQNASFLDAVSESVGGLMNNLLAQTQNLYKVLSDENASMADKIAAGLGAVSSLLGSINQIIQEQTNQNIEGIHQEQEAKLAALQLQKDAGLINETEFEKKSKQIKDAARKKEYEEKKKAFEIDKGIKIVQTIISTAQAVVTALSAGPIVGAVMAGIYGAMGAAQIALIASQNFPSEGGSGAGSSGSASFTPPSSSLPSSSLTGSLFSSGNSQEDTLTTNNGNNVTPVQVSVSIAESEITATQNTVQQIEDRSKL